MDFDIAACTVSVHTAEPISGTEEDTGLFHPDFPRRLPIDWRIGLPGRPPVSTDDLFAAEEAVSFSLDGAMASGRDPVTVSGDLVEVLRRAIIAAPPSRPEHDRLELWAHLAPLSPSQLAKVHNSFLCEEDYIAWDLAERRDHPD